MRTVDLGTEDLEDVGGPAGFGAREIELADRIGAKHLAGTVIEIAPGTAAYPYHWEADEEEWLLVLSGTPSVRTPDGTEALEPGDLVVFERGPDGAHQVRNDSDEPCRVLMLSNRSTVNVIVYPDSGKVGVRTPWLATNHPLDATLEGGGVMRKRVNVFDDTWLTPDPDDPPPYDAPFGKVQRALGAKRLGGTVVVLAPGQVVCPYHWEAGEEEWLVVLAGEAEVRTPEGTTVVPAGSVTCFPRGPEGAHRIANAGNEPARLLIVSESSTVAAAVYPDSDKVGVFGPGLGQLFRRADAVDYYDGEPGDAS